MNQEERDYLLMKIKSLQMAQALIERRLQNENQTSIFMFI